MKAWFALALAACGVPAPSFGPDGGDETCQAYQTPMTTDLMSPSVSFKTDVMPVLTGNCASASCHGVSDGAAGNLFLGAELKHGSDSGMVFTNLMVMSQQAAAMPYVTPGDPEQSYLMHKLDADQCSIASQCVGGNCQHTMPYDGQLPVETRDIVRRWIAQGAMNN
ncbi:MAG: hypothetical protein QM831_19255 [Kofleriaceae bacterium]